jgi:hypothetical protein
MRAVFGGSEVGLVEGAEVWGAEVAKVVKEDGFKVFKVLGYLGLWLVLFARFFYGH